MKPCARLSGLCGLAALVVAISFLATHASAAPFDDPACAFVDCGEATCVGDTDWPGPLCVCKDGLLWAQDKTCVADLCANMDCGEATCTKDPFVAVAECVCKEGFRFENDSKTCVDMCVGVECGLEATCVVDGSVVGCVCNKKGYWLLDDMTCVAPLVRTSMIFQKGDVKRDVFFILPQRPEQAIGTIACSSMISMGEGDAITVVWNASKPISTQFDAPGNTMCRRLLFYSDNNCTEKVAFTIARPAKKGGFYSVTKKTVKVLSPQPLSFGCEITMCENDCGSAQCVVKEGQPQCQCPEGLVFNAAKKRCLDPSLAPRRAGGQAKKGRP